MSTISRIWRCLWTEARIAQRAFSYRLICIADPRTTVRDIVGLYLDPPHHVAGVVRGSASRRSRRLSRTQPVLPMRVPDNGSGARIDYKMTWRHQPVCRSGYRDRQRSWQVLSTPSFGGVPRLPEENRHRRSCRSSRHPIWCWTTPAHTRSAPVRQWLHYKDHGMHLHFNSHACLLAQPRVTPVRTAYTPAHSKRGSRASVQATRNERSARLHRCHTTQQPEPFRWT